ncbi:histidinol-phosphate aminotransferase family protein [Allokutzneria sp. A3M-2-11 16]|uniref:pyridoxal phosphate-dependent aminotransferase n=1 Tax=Allokutzneria sp. A3M-2-11 16 TaxID=2962043 RepID=UPI0020B8D7D0|nr:histidinol-phosphate transaminase [Allokutzneria sp. A3M-2-11 16]MCP3803423.1 histidinol-phosphate aminotransferase family protein [Allokutzneria sp. A3M-2-11 16]
MTYNTSVPDADDLVRLHLSESPYGASTSAVRAAERELRRVNIYPDPERGALVGALAEHWGVQRDRVAVANGSDELVLAAALTLGERSRPGLVTTGTFPGYRSCLDRIGRGCTAVALDVAEFAEQLPEHGIGYVCNPHNPSGSALSKKDMDLLVAQADRTGVPLVFDEAYMDFADPDTPQVRDYLSSGAPIIALRTFSKAYGLAALRVGYAVGARELIAELTETLRTLPFSANRLAQAAALAALADQEFVRGVREANAAQRAWFGDELTQRGRGFLPSTTNFMAVAVVDTSAAQNRLAAEHGILVRDAGLFGFPGYIRVSLGSQDDLLHLLKALDELAL